MWSVPRPPYTGRRKNLFNHVYNGEATRSSPKSGWWCISHNLGPNQSSFKNLIKLWDCRMEWVQMKCCDVLGAMVCNTLYVYLCITYRLMLAIWWRCVEALWFVMFIVCCKYAKSMLTISSRVFLMLLVGDCIWIIGTM